MVTGEEVYRYIQYDSRNSELVQFYIREINNAQFLNFTYINPDDLEWFALGQPNDRLYFLQNNDARASAKILAVYEAENGFRIEELPDGLNVGQLYELAPSWKPPPDRVPTPIENRGWSPITTLENVGNRTVGKIIDWEGGQGVKPQTGYQGANSIVSDPANAVDIWDAIRNSGLFTLPTFATRTHYRQHAPFIRDGKLYRTLQEILETNTDDVAALLGANPPKVELIAGGGEVDLPDWVEDDGVRVPESKGGLTVVQTEIITRVGKIDIRDFRADVPVAPEPNTDEGRLAVKTIGIGNEGILWTYKSKAHHEATATWQDFENEHWEFEQTQELPRAAIETGDFWYIPNGGTGPGRGVWQVYDGTKVVDYYDAIDAFLPNHIFLGNFSSQQAAANAITSYDSNKTYLAYFPTVVEGRSGREVLQLTSYTAGTVGENRWVNSTTELHELINHIEAEIKTRTTVVDRSLEFEVREREFLENLVRFRSLPIGHWRRDTGTGTLNAGFYRADEDNIFIHHTDDAGDDKSSEISTIAVDEGITIGTGAGTKQFIVREITGYANYTEFTGKWVAEEEDATVRSVRVTIGHIRKPINLAKYVIADEIIGLEQGNVTQATVYAQLKKIIKQGSNITVTYDDAKHIITLASSGGGGASFNILAGDGPPASNLGNDGDFYREKDDGTVWRKVSGNWVEVIDLATEDELAFVKVALEALETEVTNLENEIRSVLYRTPRRVTSMPAHLDEFETIVLTEDSHGGEDVYDFVPDEATYNQGGEFYNYWGANVVNFGAKLPLIGSGFPSIFRGNRLVAIYQIRTRTGTSELQKLKVIVRTGLFNATSLTDQETKLSVRLPQYGDVLYRLRASTFDDTNAATRAIAGQSYSIYETIEDFPNFAFSTAAQNLNKASIQISQEVSGVRQFLSDDNTTVWATGIEYTAGLYQGNANRKPVEVEIIPKDTIKELKAAIESAGSEQSPSPDTSIYSGSRVISNNQTFAPFDIDEDIEANARYQFVLRRGNNDNSAAMIPATFKGQQLLDAVGDGGAISTSVEDCLVFGVGRADNPGARGFFVQYGNPTIQSAAPSGKTRLFVNIFGDASMYIEDLLKLANTAGSASVSNSNTPRRVSKLPTSNYQLGDIVQLTTKDGSNDPGLYRVFAVADGYEPAEVSRKPLVVLPSSASRNYADVVLPENFKDYLLIYILVQDSTGEILHIYPTDYLELQVPPHSLGDSVLGSIIRYVHSSRTLSRFEANQFDRFCSVILR